MWSIGAEYVYMHIKWLDCAYVTHNLLNVYIHTYDIHTHIYSFLKSLFDTYIRTFTPS